jgi:hypothetical protein
MHPTKFRFMWPSGFRKEYLKIDQSDLSVNKHGHHAILVSDWSIFVNSSPLKPIGQMNRNLVRSIYGRSAIKIAHFVAIR